MATVMTVRGPVPVEELGFTLPHEHLFINLLPELRADGILTDYELLAEELRPFREAGGQSIVDCTSTNLDPDPVRVRLLSEALDLHVVMGCGYYRDPFLDKSWFDRHNVDEVADSIVRNIEVGIGDTGIRAGVIGEVGNSTWRISAAEERSLRAAARAQLQTGVTITTHAGPDTTGTPGGLQQLAIFEAEGVDLRRVIIGHCDYVPSFEYHLEVAQRGAFVQFDTIRPGSEYQLDLRVRMILNMVSRGYLRQTLISQDVCRPSHLRSNGGGGYAFLGDVFLQRLRTAGLDDEAIRLITVDNPARALSGAV